MVSVICSHAESIKNSSIDYLKCLNYILDNSIKIDQQVVNNLKGKPFTGRYDRKGYPIFSEYKKDDYHLTLIIDNKSFSTSDKFIDVILNTHKFVNCKFLPVFVYNRN